MQHFRIAILAYLYNVRRYTLVFYCYRSI